MKEITGIQEDSIYRAKQFIQELSTVQDSYFDRLSKEMGYEDNSHEAVLLFDYIYNDTSEREFGECIN